MKKILLLFLAFNIILDVILAQKLTCDKSGERKADALMAKLLTIGNSGRKFPTNRDELKIYCNETTQLIRKLEEYKNQCLQNVPKQGMSFMLFGIKNLLNQYCKKDSKKVQELLATAPCANRATDEINKCYTKYIDALLGASNAPDNRKIPFACCEFHKIFQCWNPRIVKVDGCLEKDTIIFEDVIKSIFGSALDLICGEWSDGSDKCSKLGPPPKKRRDQRRTKSILIPLTQLLDSFPEV